MKLRTVCLSIAVAVSGMAVIPTYAQGTSKATGEASTAPVPTPASGTKAEQKAQRQASKQNVKKEHPKSTGEVSPGTPPPPKTGTHETRSADRSASQAERTQQVKKGELSGTNTAGEPKKK